LICSGSANGIQRCISTCRGTAVTRNHTHKKKHGGAASTCRQGPVDLFNGVHFSERFRFQHRASNASINFAGSTATSAHNTSTRDARIRIPCMCTVICTRASVCVLKQSSQLRSEVHIDTAYVLTTCGIRKTGPEPCARKGWQLALPLKAKRQQSSLPSSSILCSSILVCCNWLS
jgi:hypothetical protein